jgi:hypothetical protein
VTVIITSMMVMITNMVMLNVRTQTGIPKKNVCLLCADQRPDTMGKHALRRLVGPMLHAVAMSPLFTEHSKLS